MKRYSKLSVITILLLGLSVASCKKNYYFKRTSYTENATEDTFSDNTVFNSEFTGNENLSTDEILLLELGDDGYAARQNPNGDEAERKSRFNKVMAEVMMDDDTETVKSETPASTTQTPTNWTKKNTVSYASTSQKRVSNTSNSNRTVNNSYKSQAQSIVQNVPQYKTPRMSTIYTTPMPAYEGKVKQYSLVVATLSREAGMERLTNLLKSEGEDMYVVRTKAGLYQVLLGSFDTKEQAVEKYNNIIKKYAKSYTQNELLKKYGIGFSDTWILIKK